MAALIKGVYIYCNYSRIAGNKELLAIPVLYGYNGKRGYFTPTIPDYACPFTIWGFDWKFNLIFFF